MGHFFLFFFFLAARWHGKRSAEAMLCNVTLKMPPALYMSTMSTVLALKKEWTAGERNGEDDPG